eukprot:Blabericola_migrator_1__1278@NODE_1330_length_4785_cov_81_161933_g893_i0_p2_GENE_NODE_1330_length_4785_cov_81_161933_g893_i0NODE_1330_length_4785_cov_81_161933_g893_i0_p2_ORF_typecomplete_len601_score52_83Sugar_tr/PF00083_24/7_3e42Sugar_tr/PF00083_24/2_2e32MFS_1/PF07690_16/3_9e12MFS_1/PF07690_16/0_013TRI12/PF06609_13/3_1e07TRI12/PF06609_13/81MFS_3/PF05977_13/0_00092MFS_3/PF05977_13/9_8e03MFS_4/PF06779_14/0_0011MFS_4/PF06779_14/45_NODE_1330_length_4785_cov_81_161933_g893_i0641866
MIQRGFFLCSMSHRFLINQPSIYKDPVLTNDEQLDEALCMPYLVQLILTSCTGSFLFGFHMRIFTSTLGHISWEWKWCEYHQAITTLSYVTDCNRYKLYDILISSALFVGAACSSIIAGHNFSYGRKQYMQVANVVSLLGTVSTCCAESISSLLCARFVTGLAVGMDSLIIPVYLSEIAPSPSRGRYGVIHQLFITIGILVAAMLALPLLFYDPLPTEESMLFGNSSVDSELSTFARVWWRIMMSCPMVPLTVSLYLFAYVYIDETPQYHVEHGEYCEAKALLRRLRSKRDVTDELSGIIKELQLLDYDGDFTAAKKPASSDAELEKVYKMTVHQLIEVMDESGSDYGKKTPSPDPRLISANLIARFDAPPEFSNNRLSNYIPTMTPSQHTLSPLTPPTVQYKAVGFVKGMKRARYREVLLVGIGLAALQQLTGINVFIAESSKLFVQAGLSKYMPDVMAVVICLTNCISTLPTFGLIDAWGRRLLLFFGCLGLSLGLAPAAIGYSVAPDSRVTMWLAMVGCLTFIVIYAFTCGPVLWVYLPEIFTPEIKGAGVGTATAAHWITCTVVLVAANFFTPRASYVTFFGESITLSSLHKIDHQ